MNDNDQHMSDNNNGTKIKGKLILKKYNTNFNNNMINGEKLIN
jgi:hypothetical protein